MLKCQINGQNRNNYLQRLWGLFTYQETRSNLRSVLLVGLFGDLRDYGKSGKMRKVRFVDLEQDTEEWLNYRQGGVGSSDIALLMNPEPVFGRTVNALWLDRVGYEPFGFVANEHTKRGKALEPLIRDRVNELMGTDYKPVCVFREDSEHLRASLDGYDEKTDSILEIKSPAEKTFIKYLQNWEVPLGYYYQIQYQLLVTDAKYALYSFFNKSHPNPYIMLVENDYAMQLDIERRCKLFWESVKKKIPIGFRGAELSLYETNPTMVVVVCDFNFIKTYGKLDYHIPISYKLEERKESFIFLMDDIKKLPEIKKLNPNHQVKFASVNPSMFNPTYGFDSLDDIVKSSL